MTMAGGAGDFGFLMTATGIGAISAALVLAARHRPSPWWMASGAVLLGAGQIATALFPAYGAALLLLGAAGFGGIMMAATGNTLIQASVPDELRGRVMSVYTTIFAGSTPIGAILSGWIASQSGPLVALAVNGIGAALIGIIGLLWLRANRRLAVVPLPRRAAAPAPAGTIARTQPNR